MRCEEARGMLSGFLDEELDRDRASEVSRHLTRCRECRKEFSSLQAVDLALRAMPRIELTSEFSAKVLAHRKCGCVSQSMGERLFSFLAAASESLFSSSAAASSTGAGSLEEFNDFPPLSLGRLYIGLLSQSD